MSNQSLARSATRIALPTLGLCAALLAGCAPEDSYQFAPACAQVGILAEAADFSDYGASADQPDLSKLVSHGSIIGVGGHCNAAQGGTLLHTFVQVQMAIERGPAERGASLDIPYFIAVTLNGRIINKLSLVAKAQFPDNGDKVLVKTDPVDLDLAVTRTRPGSAYRLEVGFQLTPAQLDYNRAHMPR